MSAEDIRKVFKQYVCSSMTGKKLTDADQCLATDKAIAKLMKELLPEYAKTSETSIFPKMSDKTTKRLKLAVFEHDYFVELAFYKLKNEKKTDSKDSDIVKNEVERMKGLVAKKAHEAKKTDTKQPAVVGRLTDASKYTGSHKERFDEEGKGKGASGRVDQVDRSGYVGGYKGEDTYDKTH